MDVFISYAHLFYDIRGGYALSSKSRSMTAWDYIRHRARGLLIPYFCLNMLMLPVWYLNFKILGNSKTEVSSMFFGIFAANSAVLNGPTNATWFLAVLFLTTICYFLLERILKYDMGKITVWSAILGICGFLISFTELRKVNLPWHINVIPVALFFFYLGVVFMRYLPDIMKTFERHRYVYTCIFIFLGSTAGMMNGKVSMHASKYNNGLLFILSSVLISFSLVLFFWKLPENRLISFIGKNTLVITAVHCPMLRFLEQYSKSTRHFVKTYPNLTGVILLVASMAAAWIIKRYFPFLTGEKRKSTVVQKNKQLK